MRFFTLINTILAAGLFAGSLAAPSSLAEPNPVLKRSLGSGQVLTIVKTINQKATTFQTNVNQALVGVYSGSPAAVKKAASQKIIKEFGTLATALGQGVGSVTQQANSQPALLVRQSPGTNETRELINALGQLVTLINTTVIQVVSTLGLPELVPPIMAALAVLSQFFLTIAAVVIDFLPFLGPIGTFLSGVGSILNGIGTIIPGP